MEVERGSREVQSIQRRGNSAPLGAKERHARNTASTQTEKDSEVERLNHEIHRMTQELEAHYCEVERLNHKIRRMTKELDAHYSKFNDVFTKLGYLDPYAYEGMDSEVKEHLYGVWRSLYYDLDAWLGGPMRFER